jgi:hypothetical protein
MLLDRAVASNYSPGPDDYSIRVRQVETWGYHGTCADAAVIQVVRQS